MTMAIKSNFSHWYNKTKQILSHEYHTDPNIKRLKSWPQSSRRRDIPSAIADYITRKFPFVEWLPHYDYRNWLLQDIIAGITIGVMFIPQGLAYAKIANIPVEHGLYSCWLPPVMYFFLGTSKELSAGPTSILGLLTAEIIADLSSSPQSYTPAEISSAICFIVGLFSTVMGLLRLGFLLDFISTPVLTGWISAVALVILMGQIDGLIGMDVPSGTVSIIRGILGHLDRIKPLTLVVGLGGIVLLLSLQFMGKKWGANSTYVRILATSRAVVVLVMFTMISFLVNRGRKVDNYKWEVTRVNTHGLLPPRAPQGDLLSRVASRSLAPLIAMAVEHLGVGKAFGLRNNYSIDKSQELFFLGVSNICNSFFGAMTTGAAMSRTAVNSECGVKSPVNFLFTSGFILLTLYKLAAALYWIPKATLSAIIIMAVVNLISSPLQFYRYYRISSTDFLASMIAFWVTLFTSTEIGLAAAVGFNILFTLLRLAFPHCLTLSHNNTNNHSQSIIHPYIQSSITATLPPESFYVRFSDALLFPNAERTKTAIIQSIKINYDPAAATTSPQSRSWNVSDTKKIPKLRRRLGIAPSSAATTRLEHVVLDFTSVTYMDITGLLSLIELKAQLRSYIGDDLRFRILGVNGQVMRRFERAEWEFVHEGKKIKGENADALYESLEMALFHWEGDMMEDNRLVKSKTLDV